MNKQVRQKIIKYFNSLLLFQLRLSLSLSQFIVNRFFFQFQLGFLASVPAMMKPLRQFGLSVGNLQIVATENKLFGNLYQQINSNTQILGLSVEKFQSKDNSNIQNYHFHNPTLFISKTKQVPERGVVLVTKDVITFR